MRFFGLTGGRHPLVFAVVAAVLIVTETADGTRVTTSAKRKKGESVF